MDKFKDVEFYNQPKILPSIVNRLFENWDPKVSVDGMKFKINEQEAAFSKQA